LEVDAKSTHHLVNNVMKQKYKDEMRREFVKE
jgi:hypothetical protein